MTNDTPVNDGGTCGQSADSADNVRTSETPMNCPFCGGSNALVVKPHTGPPVHYTVICTNGGDDEPGCGASSTWANSSREAIETWNRRTITAAETLQAIIEDERDFAPSTFMKGREATEPRTISETFGLPAGSFVKHLVESKASGMSHEERSMMPTPASYGEPWSVGEYNCKTSVVNAAGDEVAVFDSDKDADLAVQCVNACQGIADPVEALREARDVLPRLIEIADGHQDRGPWDEGYQSIELMTLVLNARATLAKLTPA